MKYAAIRIRESRYTKAVWTTAALVVVSLLAESAAAGTVAYWRHEEGTAGGVIAAGANSVLDETGNNDMRTYDPTFTSASYTSAVSPLPLRSGLPNTLSLDFGPGGDDAGLNDDNYTDGKPINSQTFTAITAELAFRMDSVGPGQYQTLLGKDGMPTASLAAPLQIKVRGDDFPGGIDNQLQVEWIDGDGDVHGFASGFTIAASTWYHVAFVMTDTSAELYIADESGDYNLVASKSDDFAGGSSEVLINSSGNWSTGRGFFNNGIVDWADAHIDEVRVSDMALSPSEFLFVPEPGSLVLASIALLCVHFRSSRKRTSSRSE